jgi:hypothetical protein
MLEPKETSRQIVVLEGGGTVLRGYAKLRGDNQGDLSIQN